MTYLACGHPGVGVAVALAVVAVAEVLAEVRDGVGPGHEAPGLEHGHADRRVVHLAVNDNTGYGTITPDIVSPGSGCWTRSTASPWSGRSSTAAWSR